MFKNLLGSIEMLHKQTEGLNSMNADDTKLVICVEPECDNKFEMTPGEINFYITKGLELPKRCKSCRTSRNQSPLTYKTTKKAKQEYVLSEVVCEN